MIDNLKGSGEWKIQLKMKVNFIPSKDRLLLIAIPIEINKFSNTTQILEKFEESYTSIALVVLFLPNDKK